MLSRSDRSFIAHTCIPKSVPLMHVCPMYLHTSNGPRILSAIFWRSSLLVIVAHYPRSTVRAVRRHRLVQMHKYRVPAREVVGRQSRGRIDGIDHARRVDEVCKLIAGEAYGVYMSRIRCDNHVPDAVLAEVLGCFLTLFWCTHFIMPFTTLRPQFGQYFGELCQPAPCVAHLSISPHGYPQTEHP